VTDFEEDVVAVISSLRPGDVVTYGEVAAEAGHPGAARAVGTILRKTEGLPWWRVVGSGGRIRTPNPGEQIRLLTDEGILIVNGRVVG
jgi:methylated-DNA-protein-cysteine methyltransferase-like protein